jgi:Zn-finger nucleic acid-binding protein
MICPICKSDMIVIEYSKIELDYCASCHGVWFDSGELELLLESTGIDSTHPLLSDILNSKEAKSSEKKRRCPLCGKKMQKVTIGQQNGILIDVCKQGEGLWLDGGELNQLIRLLVDKSSSETESKQQVINFLGEVFKGLE